MYSETVKEKKDFQMQIQHLLKELDDLKYKLQEEQLSN